MPQNQDLSQPQSREVRPEEGLHVIHSFFRFRLDRMGAPGAPAATEARARFLEIAQSIAETPDTQLILFSCVGGRADWGLMLLGPELHALDQAFKNLTLHAAPGCFQEVFSYYSMTERSEYTTSKEEYSRMLWKSEGFQPGTKQHEEKLREFEERIQKYTRDRLYPRLPEWPVLCFYPMFKRRSPGQNWYSLPFEQRKELMKGHARVGRTYAGKILQLITGSTGLDDMEWGVTLFAKSTSEIRQIVYEMRFDPVSAEYAEFGKFFIGLVLPPDALLDRIGL